MADRTGNPTSGDAEPTRPVSLPVTVTATTAALAGGALLVIIGLWNVLISARSILATAVGAIVVALLVSGPVSVLDRRLPRPLAIATTLLLLVAAMTMVFYAAVDDLDAAFARLQREAPAAAAALEDSDRFGEIATDLRLEERVTTAVDRLRDNAQDRAQATALRSANYFIAAILAIFFLVYGERMFHGAIRQVDDEEQVARYDRIASRTIDEARTYLGLELAHALVVGLVTFGVFRYWLDLPGAAALALVAGAGSAIPDIGILASSLPALLLTAALEPYGVFVALTALVIVFQAADSVFAHRRLVQTVDVGPAVSLLSVLLGFAVYGVGGAVFGFAVAVFASALIDAIGAEREREAASPAT